VTPVGVVVMAHGTPATIEELPAFYTEIRRGRPPTAEQLADLRTRYAAIGGTSPLNERTRAQVAGVQAALDRHEPAGFVVALGMKFAAPRIEDAVAALSRRGVERIIGVVLAPHSSVVSVGDYTRRATDAARSLRRATAGTSAPDVRSSPAVPELNVVDHWYDAPGFATLVAARTIDAVASLPAEGRARATVLFTAHSVPRRVVEDGDTYPEQVADSAAAVAEAAGLERWDLAWQSAGRTPEPWLGPDMGETIRALPGRGATGVVVCPIGFVSDHLEVLYDVDIEARAVAGSVGLPLARTASFNDDPRFCELLAGVVRDAAASRPVRSTA
jgi:ferrochelatase